MDGCTIRCTKMIFSGLFWHENDEEVDVHITFEPLENILDALSSEEEL